MDPLSALGLACNVVDLIKLAIDVSKLVGEYSIAVKNAPKEIRKLQEEYSALSQVLQQLENFLRHESAINQKFAQTSVLFLSIASCQTNLEDVAQKLRIPSEKRLLRAMERILWPFSEKEVKKMLETLRKYISMFKFSLEVENCVLLSQTSDRVASILELQRAHEIKLSQMMSGISDSAKNHQILADQTTFILQLIASLPDIATEIDSISQQLLGLTKASHDEAEARVLDWISDAPVAQRHHEVRHARTSGTGKWLLSHPDFQAWLAGALPSNILWCVGDPGVGKTFLTSIVIDHLQDQLRVPSLGIAYLYFDGRPETASNFAPRLLKQLAMQMSPLPQELLKFYQCHKRTGIPSSSTDYCKILQSLCSDFMSCFIIIDALDEVKNQKTRKEILHIINSLESAGANVLVTSRPHLGDINQGLSISKRIPIKAREEDMKAYISKTLNDDDHMTDLVDEVLRETILSKVSQGADGMFLVTVLQIQLVTSQETTKGVRKALQSMSTDLTQLFEDSINRIENYSSQRKDIALRTLMWLSCAQRPLQVPELLHALATTPGNLQFDPEDCLPIKTIIESCSGLVTSDNESSIIRLVHSTLEEYLVAKRQTMFPEAHAIITSICLTYLLLDSASFNCGGTIPEGEPGSYDDILTAMPFLSYASENWGHHAKEVPATKFENLAMKFLLDKSKITRTAGVRAALKPKTLKAENIHRKGGIGFQYQLHNSRESIDENEINAYGLHMAAFFGLADLLIPLLKGGTDIDLADPNDLSNTALHVAAFEGHIDVCNILLDQRADPNTRNIEHNSPLFLATAVGQLEVARTLLHRGALPDISRTDGWRALHKAADMGNLELVRVLLDHGANVHTVSARGVTALSRAAGRGYIEVVSLLLNHGADINSMTRDGWTPLHGAARSGQVEVVKLLLKEGADPSFSNSARFTPLHQACRGGHVEVAALLLQQGVSRMAKDNHSRIALHEAAEGGHTSVVRLLLEHDTRQLLQTDSQGNTAHDVAISAGEYESADLLQKLESSLLGQGNLLKTDLERAVEERNQTSLTALIEKSGDINALGSKGLSALHQALLNDLYDISSILLQQGADIEAETSDGWRALHCAARRGNLRTVQLCLDHRADVNATTSRGQIPLHMACQNGNTETVTLLLQHGSDIEHRDNQRARPIHKAASSGNEDALLLLLDKGALLRVKDRKGASVQSSATLGGHHALAEVVRKQLGIGRR